MRLFVIRFGLAPIKGKMCKTQLRWFGLILKKTDRGSYGESG